MRVLIATGGTGGHVFPALSLADRLARDHDADVRFMGTPEGPEATRVPAAGFRFDAVRALPLARELSWRAARAPAVALRSARGCLPTVRGVDVAVGMGGYASVPAMIAAWRAGVPIVLHEANAVPGLATRLFARAAVVIAAAFQDVRRRLPRRSRIEVIGYPVPEAILAVPTRRAHLAEEARSTLGLVGGRPTVLVWGGSQGALHLDLVVAEALPTLATRSDVQLLVLTGRAHEAVVAGPATGMPGVRVLPFLERMELAYAGADLAVSRAGATAIAEQTICGLPTVLVPYPHATENHQEANARELERNGAAEVVLDAALTPRTFVERVRGLLGDPAGRTAMAASATAWSKPDAAERFADLVAEVGKT